MGLGAQVSGLRSWFKGSTSKDVYLGGSWGSYRLLRYQCQVLAMIVVIVA